ncbi:inorganic phosphate transporter [Palaeococcus sp. (in: euryarchaeotes)]
MKSIRTVELTYQWMIILSASYTAFNLGANELSNVIGIILYGFSLKGWLIRGLLSFGLIMGALTFSYNVIRTIGRELVSLGPLSAFSSQFGS